MRIYVVKPGDTVWSIARRFGVTPQSIINANKLSQDSSLVVGQTLVIPSTEIAYRVRSGDTLWSIARKFRVSVDAITQLNNITNSSPIYPGLMIRIPENAKNYGYIEVNAFIQPSNPQKENAVLGEAIQYLTYVTPFSHHVTADAGLTPLNDENIIRIAKENKVAPMLSVTNISGTTGANFNSELISNILNSNSLQQTLINNILNMIRSKGYYGVVVDFERIPPEDRQKYNNFFKKTCGGASSKLYCGYSTCTKNL
ncbi:LysM peptidoglycan-binding domain-containing protein [Clostridium sp. DMHC 10]|uniref:LysM peptidoglycan-binding domain-containing protein n=1 Tax=Clostridium sp. DMHC 10 TaxID=747377 RepID=UPI000B1047F9|nr:LysM peptidoglycan-binding domain-containing protein [Clostridium sp. DMHC 10]